MVGGSWSQVELRKNWVRTKEGRCSDSGSWFTTRDRFPHSRTPSPDLDGSKVWGFTSALHKVHRRKVRKGRGKGGKTVAYS